MKRPSSKIREEIVKLQEQLRHAESREAERIGRIALKVGLGDIKIDDAELQTAFEEVVNRFRRSLGQKSKAATATVSTGSTPSGRGED